MLGELFDKHGSDKQRLMGYGPLYDEVTSGRSVTRVLEIGVKSGASLLAWAEAFPLAKVIGIDLTIDPVSHACATHPRITCIETDSTDPEIELAARAPFDLIVDDGCHALHAQCETMRNFLPLLHPEGVYVVEDVETDDNAVRLRQLASLMGHDSELRLSACAPNIYDNRLVVVAGRDR